MSKVTGEGTIKKPIRIWKKQVEGKMHQGCLEQGR